MVRRSNPAERDDDAADAMDVPAAVVCAVCGSGDCPGCTYEQTGQSGVVAIVPWERPTMAPLSRLFATVQATTQGAETFFFAVPDGSVAPALTFAVLSEGCAVFSMAVVIAPIAVAVLPGASAFLASPANRQIVLAAATVGILGFTALLVGAHALHGVLLGNRSRRRALRAGLYACGWDFGASPAGVVFAVLHGGAGSVVSLVRASISAPRRGMDAALEGIFQTRGAAASRVRRRAVLIAMAASVVAVVVLTGVVAAMLLAG
jgi:hypothetical protein